MGHGAARVRTANLTVPCVVPFQCLVASSSSPRHLVLFLLPRSCRAVSFSTPSKGLVPVSALSLSCFLVSSPRPCFVISSPCLFLVSLPRSFRLISSPRPLLVLLFLSQPSLVASSPCPCCLVLDSLFLSPWDKVPFLSQRLVPVLAPHPRLVLVSSSSHRLVLVLVLLSLCPSLNTIFYSDI